MEGLVPPSRLPPRAQGTGGTGGTGVTRGVGIAPDSLSCHENSPALGFNRGILLTLQEGY